MQVILCNLIFVGGILLVDENKKITIARKAKKRQCLFRQETLTEAVTHSL